MTGLVRHFGRGDLSQLNFSDNFTRADKNTLGPNWLRSLFNNPGGAGNGATGAAIISSNTATMTTVSGVAPANNYLPLWVPMPVYTGLYNLPGVFVQCTFQSAAGAGSALVLRYNHDMNNGVTENEGSDVYQCLLPGAAAGRIDKIVGGGAPATIGAGATTLVAGDIIRMEVLTGTGLLQLRVLVNGAILQTITDATATRILAGVPGFMFSSISATGQTLVLRAFSCGPIAALSG